MKYLIVDAMFIVGIGGASVGTAMMYLPAGIIVGGLGLCLLALVTARGFKT